MKISAALLKIEEKLKKFIGTYPFRKIAVSLFAVFGLVTIIGSFRQISFFQEFIIYEKKIKLQFFDQDTLKLMSQGQDLIINPLLWLTATLSIIIIIFSLIALYFLVTNKYSGYIFLRINTWLYIVNVLFIIIVLSIKVGDIEFRDTQYSRLEIRQNPNIGLHVITGPNFAWTKAALGLSVIGAFLAGIVRKEYGYLERDYVVTKYEKMKKL